MRHATEPPCDKSQSYLIGAGGVRRVCAGCAMRGVGCARLRRGKGGRAAHSAADHSKEPQWDKFQDYLKGNKEFYVLAAVRAASDSRGVLTPHTVPRTLFRYACSASCFASVAKQFPKEADELFAAAQENAQWRYKSYLRMLGTAW